MRTKNSLGLLCALTAIAIGLVGCDGDSDSHSGNSPYQGSYAGTYSGTYEGTWSVTIYGDGYAVGKAYNVAYNESFSVAGTTTEQGQVALTSGGVSDGTLWRGQITLAGRISGTWTGTDGRGQFSGQRQ